MKWRMAIILIMTIFCSGCIGCGEKEPAVEDIIDMHIKSVQNNIEFIKHEKQEVIESIENLNRSLERIEWKLKSLEKNHEHLLVKYKGKGKKGFWASYQWVSWQLNIVLLLLLFVWLLYSIYKRGKLNTP